MRKSTTHFRFYAELNDFLPPHKRAILFPYNFTGHPSIKDAIEAIGVPHTEVDLILVNGQSVNFNFQINDKDHISVYPVFEALDIADAARLRDKPLREPKFILDVHLGKLCRLLRLMGFDSLYSNNYSDTEIIDIALKQHRIILTRDRGLLKFKKVTHGYCPHSFQAQQQLCEVLQRFDLFSQVKPFIRCIGCNGCIERVEKQDVIAHIPAKAALYYQDFSKCQQCGKIYWKGSHYRKMQEAIERIIHEPPGVDARKDASVNTNK